MIKLHSKLIKMFPRHGLLSNNKMSFAVYSKVEFLNICKVCTKKLRRTFNVMYISHKVLIFMFTKILLKTFCMLKEDLQVVDIFSFNDCYT